MWRRLDEPSLWDAFLVLMRSRDFAADTEDERRASLLAIARDAVDSPELWELSEGLLEHDSLASQWRSRHVDMVERQIGTKSGTGGSSGAPDRRTRLAVRYFPELWELRSWL
jgi:tryptophan 2,3-dioxygenase